MTPKEKAIKNLDFCNYLSGRDKEIILETIDIALKEQAKEYEKRIKREVEIRQDLLRILAQDVGDCQCKYCKRIIEYKQEFLR